MVLLLACSMGGCKSFEEDLIVHDELFMYEKGYDYVFMKVIDAVDEMDGWRLIDQDIKLGAVTVRSADFMCDDEVDVMVKRVDRKKTTVELAAKSQQTKGVEKILKAIDRELYGY